MDHLRDENHVQKLQFGSSRLYSLTSAERTWPSAASVYDSGPVAGSVRFEWDALEWFEEDEPLILHPRNPYVRVDSLRSHRHIRVELDGMVLAETHSPVLLFETGLPTRFYIDRTDVEFSHLEPSKTESVCPYKGITSAYWTFRKGDAVHPDIAWAYDYPLRESTHRRDDRFLQREARHLRRRRVVVSPSHHLHVARCEGNWSGDDAQFAKSGELPPEALVRVDAIRETCWRILIVLWIVASPKLSIQSTNAQFAIWS